MKVMVFNQYGENLVFEQMEIEIFVVEVGYVFVCVKVISINIVDIMICYMGKDFFLLLELFVVLGMDFVGIVELVGVGVIGFESGDEVYGCVGGLVDLQGVLVEYMVVDV